MCGLKLSGRSTSTLVVDGHFLTNPVMVVPQPALNKAMLQVVEALVVKARAGKGG
ncbi:MAG: hypothetical protein V4634_03790 [Pseudomonadota bacterium]